MTNWPQRTADEEENEAVTVVTWGVFPRRAILQPTIVSLESYSQWAPEAFGLWESPLSTVAWRFRSGHCDPSWLLFNVVDSELQNVKSAGEGN